MFELSDKGVLSPKIKRRKRYHLETVMVYRESGRRLKNVKGIKIAGELYGISNLPYILKKNKGKELSECTSANGFIFKVEDKFAF